MIKEINKTKVPKWEEKIQLEMSLADLQVIYDCVGAVPLDYLETKHKNTNFKDYSAIMITDLYEELDNIIYKHYGIGDDNENVNLNITLEMIGEENE